MAKTKKPRTIKPKAPPSPAKGPFLACALICERIMNEADGVQSLIRVVDKVGIPPTSVTGNETGKLVGIPLSMFVSFRAGSFKGRSLVLLVQRGPSGKSESIGVTQLDFNGEESHNFNVISPVIVKWDGAGQYWYEIFLDNKFCTKMPLTIELAASKENRA